MGGNLNREVIGVVGGMGPLAGVRLVELITRLTPATRDQNHRDLVLVSMPGRISDRTEFLLGRGEENPAAAVAHCVQVLARAGATCVAVACNSVHVPLIWDDITAALARDGCDVPLLHLIEETGLEIAARLAPGSKVGVLGTNGTVRSDLYGRVLRAEGFEVLYLDDFRQCQVHAAIYNDEDGIKSAAEVSERVRELVAQAAQNLIDGGAQCIVLGCTELPLALPVASLSGVPVIDPSVIMARRLIFGPRPEREPVRLQGSTASGSIHRRLPEPIALKAHDASS
ncbi:hypothetical protein A5724_07160 [Mycobacterium sp. ACS1612]|uniref:aspartate/glutamate racemase family protein n=1 Tax=Mycobacterium sp. ACS1612 TaxID=1834117 RepID=UPI0007FE39EF|nr:amino acid racemase [Mycobacterium sp. ACS1612]OBF40825.1 hypothetical protein A5724_07160 [Mycobacterium sp. ACS1612]